MFYVQNVSIIIGNGKKNMLDRKLLIEKRWKKYDLNNLDFCPHSKKQEIVNRFTTIKAQQLQFKYKINLINLFLISINFVNRKQATKKLENWNKKRLI